MSPINAQNDGPAFPFRFDDWQCISGNPNNYLMYASPKTVKRNRNIVSVWVMRTTFAYQKWGLIPQIEGLSAKSLENIDCENHYIRWEQLITYDGIMGSGQPVKVYRTPISWQSIVPDTDGETLFDFFCDRKMSWWQ
jgi:hypothetical protein